MNLVEMMQDFGDESKCRAYLESLRWPDGLRCPHCKGEKIYRIVKRDQFLCASCEYQFSVTVDTIFHDTHLPLVTWFLATVLLCEAKKGMSACQIQRSLGIKTYKTAWYLCHRIRAAMLETGKAKLDGVVEIDETYVGGKQRGRGKHRGMENKETVIGIRKRNGELRFFHAKDAKSETLAQFIRENVSEKVDVIITDECACLSRRNAPNWNDSTQNHQAQEPRLCHGRRSHEHRGKRLFVAETRDYGNVA